LHPYALALLSSIPQIDPASRKRRILLTGDVPSPVNPPSGYRFHPRCPLANERCRVEEPRTITLGEPFGALAPGGGVGEGCASGDGESDGAGVESEDQGAGGDGGRRKLNIELLRIRH
jgi:oligopeptide/dipeptide ABC transporter ATP-binding protein